jgi:hypothetical protein
MAAFAPGPINYRQLDLLMIIIFWEMIIIIVTAVETSNLTARPLL